jgi:hypothetical protein
MGPDAMNQKPKVPLGSGMAQQGARTLQGLPYQRHVQEAKAMGQAPLTPEQFLQQSGG